MAMIQGPESSQYLSASPHLATMLTPGVTFRLRWSGNSIFTVLTLKRADFPMIIPYQYIRLGAFLLFGQYGLHIFGERPNKLRSCLVRRLLTLVLAHKFRPKSPFISLQIRSLKVSKVLMDEKCGFNIIL